MTANLIMPEDTEDSLIKVEPGVFNIKHDETQDDDLSLGDPTKVVIEKSIKKDVKKATKTESDQKEPVEPEYRGVAVKIKDAANILIGTHHYKLVYQYRDGFDPERVGQRFESILNKYDYIVGDWGYDQLRLRGFYNERNHSANRDQNISTLQDYINEFCNFGCAFFVLEKDEPTNPTHHSNTANRRHKRGSGNSNKTTRANTTAKSVHETGKSNPKTKSNRRTNQSNKATRTKNATNSDQVTKNERQHSGKSTRNKKPRAQNQTRANEKSGQVTEGQHKTAQNQHSNFTVHTLTTSKASQQLNRQPDNQKKQQNKTTSPRSARPTTAKKHDQKSTTSRPQSRSHEFHIRQLED